MSAWPSASSLPYPCPWPLPWTSEVILYCSKSFQLLLLAISVTALTIHYLTQNSHTGNNTLMDFSTHHIHSTDRCNCLQLGCSYSHFSQVTRNSIDWWIWHCLMRLSCPTHPSSFLSRPPLPSGRTRGPSVKPHICSTRSVGLWVGLDISKFNLSTIVVMHFLCIFYWLLQSGLLVHYHIVLKCSVGVWKRPKWKCSWNRGLKKT